MQGHIAKRAGGALAVAAAWRCIDGAQPATPWRRRWPMRHVDQSVARRRPHVDAAPRRRGASAAWNATGRSEARDILEAMADAMERETGRLIAILAREGGKTLDDCIAEVREAVDFCRYYAARGGDEVQGPRDALPGPAGETNRPGDDGAGRLRLHLAVEFSAGDFHGADRGGAGGGQYACLQSLRNRRR